jgi:tRNA (Thr-GGU) A37 N-methylase
MSVVEVLRIDGNIIHVKGLDIRDGTPVLDIKPYVEQE